MEIKGKICIAYTNFRHCFHTLHFPHTHGRLVGVPCEILSEEPSQSGSILVKSLITGFEYETPYEPEWMTIMDKSEFNLEPYQNKDLIGKTMVIMDNSFIEDPDDPKKKFIDLYMKPGVIVSQPYVKKVKYDASDYPHFREFIDVEVDGKKYCVMFYEDWIVK